MKLESEFKSLIKRSVINKKGVYISLAAPVFSGVPDAYIVIPSFIPILVEAKWLGKIKIEKFSRQVPFTAMQIDWIKNCDDVCAYSAMGLIGFKYGPEAKVHCALVKYGTPLFYNFTQAFLTDCSFVTICKPQKTLDIVELFAKVPIPRMQTKVGDTILSYDLSISEKRLAASN